MSATTYRCRRAVRLAVDESARRAWPPSSRKNCRSRGSSSADETGWKVGGHLQWLWAAVATKTTVYAIQPGRGFEEAANLLGPDFDGVLIRDGWAPYRRFTQATHQTCLAHYADIRIMPMSAQAPLPGGTPEPRLSA